ncbi:kynurenine/2-aminoadipate aminotransferase [Methylophilaceae bacterium]|nr:kynurenine/2-aminoadipate aminotransferase [Methylophilaceae bacterium]
MLRPWELKTAINRDTDVAIYLQIAQKIIDEIKRGRLLPGTVLPGTRLMAQELGVNRKTVMLAYDELVAQGWLATENKRGTFVSPDIPHVEFGTALPDSLHKIAKPRYKLYGSPLAYEDVIPGDGLINFSDGIPDTRLIPFEILYRSFRHALIASSRSNRLAYSDPRGSFSLRQAILSMVNMERGLSAGIDNVCIVRGTQMGIFLAARMVSGPGDCVIVERLCYPPARSAFQSTGATVINANIDNQGLIPDEVEALCKKHPVRAVYLTAHHQFPTTVMLPAERRLKLLMLAEQYNFVIIEDDYDHEFHFSHRPMMPLASMDYAGRVIYVGSMSKVLAPGLRIGYIIAHADVINRCAADIMLIDRQGSAITELAVAELLDTGEVKRHIRRTVRIYDERRLLTAQLICRHLGDKVSFVMPDGGLALWLQVDKKLDVDLLVGDALGLQVRILPGSIFSDRQAPVHGIRLGYGNLDSAELEVGVQRLKMAFDRQPLTFF